MPHTPTTDLHLITHPGVHAAITALQNGNATAWFDAFAPNAQLYDDGNPHDLHSFWQKAIGHEFFTHIDKVENNGLDIYGHFHSDTWGDFTTYFKFHFDANKKITRLDIGQAG